MDVETPIAFNVPTKHVVLLLPNGIELEEYEVVISDSLWSILCKFQNAFNQNLCHRRNEDNRFELPQIIYNSYPFASTLKQLLSTKLSEITKHRKNKSDPVTLRLIFKAQSFSIHDLDRKLSQIEKELKKQEKESSMDIDRDDKENEDNDSDRALSDDFAKDIDPKQAESTEQIFRKMEMLLYKLSKSFKSKEQFIKCMKLLRKIVNNLILHQNPEDVKYRKLNLKNDKLRNNLFKYDTALDLLRLIGFKEVDSYLILNKENENQMVFAALVMKISNCEPPKESAPIIDKEIKIYLLDDLRRFKVEESRIIAQQNAHRIETESSLANKQRIAAQNAYKKAHPTKLMGHDLREKMYGVKQKDYKYTLIHVEFASKYVLESKFHPNCGIYKLFEFIDSVLDQNIANVKYDLLLPPRQIIKNMNDDEQTFKSMGGMIPACTVRFAFKKNTNYDGKYIKDELIHKYLTKDITSWRAQDKRSATKNNDEKKEDVSNENKKKSAKKTAAEFKAMKRKKALQNKLARLNKK